MFLCLFWSFWHKFCDCVLNFNVRIELETRCTYFNFLLNLHFSCISRISCFVLLCMPMHSWNRFLWRCCCVGECCYSNNNNTIPISQQRACEQNERPNERRRTNERRWLPNTSTNFIRWSWAAAAATPTHTHTHANVSLCLYSVYAVCALLNMYFQLHKCNWSAVPFAAVAFTSFFLSFCYSSCNCFLYAFFFWV